MTLFLFIIQWILFASAFLPYSLFGWVVDQLDSYCDGLVCPSTANEERLNHNEHSYFSDIDIIYDDFVVGSKKMMLSSTSDPYQFNPSELEGSFPIDNEYKVVFSVEDMEDEDEYYMTYYEDDEDEYIDFDAAEDFYLFVQSVSLLWVTPVYLYNSISTNFSKALSYCIRKAWFYDNKKETPQDMLVYIGLSLFFLLVIVGFFIHLFVCMAFDEGPHSHIFGDIYTFFSGVRYSYWYHEVSDYLEGLFTWKGLGFEYFFSNFLENPYEEEALPDLGGLPPIVRNPSSFTPWQTDHLRFATHMRENIFAGDGFFELDNFNQGPAALGDLQTKFAKWEMGIDALSYYEPKELYDKRYYSLNAVKESIENSAKEPLFLLAGKVSDDNMREVAEGSIHHIKSSIESNNISIHGKGRRNLHKTAEIFPEDYRSCAEHNEAYLRRVISIDRTMEFDPWNDFPLAKYRFENEYTTYTDWSRMLAYEGVSFNNYWHFNYEYYLVGPRFRAQRFQRFASALAAEMESHYYQFFASNHILDKYEPFYYIDDDNYRMYDIHEDFFGVYKKANAVNTDWNWNTRYTSYKPDRSVYSPECLFLFTVLGLLDVKGVDECYLTGLMTSGPGWEENPADEIGGCYYLKRHCTDFGELPYDIYGIDMNVTYTQGHDQKFYTRYSWEHTWRYDSIFSRRGLASFYFDTNYHSPIAWYLKDDMISYVYTNYDGEDPYLTAGYCLPEHRHNWRNNWPGTLQYLD